MQLPPDSERNLDRVVLVFALALFLLVSPLKHWWAADGSPWLMPYLLWLGIIALGFLVQRWRDRHDREL